MLSVHHSWSEFIIPPWRTRGETRDYWAVTEEESESPETEADHKPFGSRIAALFLALTAAVLMASPVFANWCTHVYGSRHAYSDPIEAHH